MHFEYIRFFGELLEAKGLNVSQAADYVTLKTGYKVTKEQGWEFLSQNRKSCPQTVMVKVWEQAFEISLPARYYGADDAMEKVKGQ